MSSYRKRILSQSKDSQSLQLNGDVTLNVNSEKWLAVSINLVYLYRNKLSYLLSQYHACIKNIVENY